jgi:hypothetical protein
VASVGSGIGQWHRAVALGGGMGAVDRSHLERELSVTPAEWLAGVAI